jgi:hypothetical protein
MLSAYLGPCFQSGSLANVHVRIIGQEGYGSSVIVMSDVKQQRGHSLRTPYMQPGLMPAFSALGMWSPPNLDLSCHSGCLHAGGLYVQEM